MSHPHSKGGLDKSQEQEQKNFTVQERIVKAIRQAGRPLSPKQLLPLVGTSYENLRRELRAMYHDGVLSQPDYGLYTLEQMPPPVGRLGVEYAILDKRGNLIDGYITDDQVIDECLKWLLAGNAYTHETRYRVVLLRKIDKGRRWLLIVKQKD